LSGTLPEAYNITVDNITTNSADVNWDGEGAQTYRILYYETGTSDNHFLSATSSPATIMVLPATTYTVRIKTLINDEWSSYANPVEFTSLDALKSTDMSDHIPEISEMNIQDIILYPNPVADVLNIEYTLENKSDFIISLYDLKGNLITVIEQSHEAGKYITSFDIRNVMAGVYFIRIQSTNFIETRKLIINRD